MNTLETYYTYSKLSQAAYVDLSPLAIGGKNPRDNTNIVKAAKDQERVPLALAQTIFSDDASNPDAWTMLSPYYRTGGRTGHSDPTSGFAGMLLSNATYGKVLAIAGTEPGKDWQTYYDLVRSDAGEIGFLGMAFRQAVSLFNYVQELSAIKGQEGVLRLTVRDVISSVPPPGVRFAAIPYGPGLSHYYWLEASHDGTGQGGLLPGEKFTVTGHSLGGHVAALAVALFPNLVTQAYTFNIPGHDPVSSALGAGSTGFLALFGEYGAQPVALDTIANRVVTLESEDAIPGDDNEIVSSTFTGTPFSPETYITTEKVTHDIGHLTESLALQSMLAKLDATMTKDRVGKILAATTSQPVETYEKLLEQLTKLFTGSGINLARTEPSFSAIDAGDFAVRNVFFEKYFALLNNSAYKTAVTTGATVRDLSYISVGLAQAGPDALAYRYALKELNPFVILGADYGIHNQNGELNLVKDGGEITEQYLTDRALFLTGVIDANTNDTGSGKNLQADTGGEPTYFEDKTTGITLQTQNSGSGQGTSGPNYRFGGTGNDSFFGTDQVDHLYGGAGSDRLDGGKGNDYLEGGSGADSFTGGKGNDTLSGGAGLDIYTLNSGDGWDWIEDSDGKGALYYGEIQLTGGKAVGDSGMVWQQTAGAKVFTYILTDWTENGTTFKRLSIQCDDDGVMIKGWQAGQLGIKLEAGQAPVRTPAILTRVGAQGTLFGGDASDNIITGGVGSDVLAGGRGKDKLEGGDGTDYLFGDGAITRAEANWYARPPKASSQYPDTKIYDFGNWDWNTLDGTLVPDPQHTGLNTWELSTVGEDDIMLGGAGDDYLHGGAGRDAMEGGKDNDSLYGGVGDDLLFGQDGKDSLSGGLGDDYASGGAGDDVLEGDDAYSLKSGFGNDELDGGAGNDTLKGMGGNDVLYGGDGNDALNGDSIDTAPEAVGDDYLSGGDGDDSLDGSGGADRLYGGAGKDKLYGDSAENPAGIQGNDYLDGGLNDDLLVGAGGTDTLYGGSGNDTLSGDSSSTPAAIHGNDYLDGGDGNDLLTGDGGADALYGGAGDDTLAGEASTTPVSVQGSDYLDGGEGNDELNGGGGADVLYGGRGNDKLYGDASDTPANLLGADLLDGGEGNDTLNGGGGADTLIGGGGNDQLLGGAGNDRLEGGAGADTLAGGEGDDTYVGVDETDTFSDTQGKNLIDFSSVEGVQSAEVINGQTTLQLSNGQTLLLNDAWYAEGSTTIQLAGSSLDVERYLGATVKTSLNFSLGDGGGKRFGGAGGDILTGGAGSDTLLGYAGDDQLSGGAGIDSLDGGAGNDTLAGGAGADTYVFGLGSGQDVINNSDSDALGVNVDSIRLGSGITTSDVSVFRSGGDLVVKLNGKTDSLTIRSYFNQDATSSYAVENIRFQDGMIWDVATVKAKVLMGTAGNDVLLGYSGNDSLSGGEGVDTLIGGEGNDVLDGGSGADSLLGDTGNDTLRGGLDADFLQAGEGNDLVQGNEGNDSIMGDGGADTLDGGSGNDSLYGGSGADIYLFGRGAGQDVVYNYDTDALGVSADTIQLGVGVAVADVAVSRSNYDLLIQIKGTGDSLKVINYFLQDAGDVRAVENIKFFDGTTWNIGTVKAKVLAGSASNDTILGYASNDSLTGGDGNDSLYGYDGSDTLNGGAGNDEMTGGNGSDVYVFERGSGKDVITNMDSDAFGVNPDRIQLGAGIVEADVNVLRSGSNLVLSIKNTQDTLTVRDYFNGSASSPAAIESIRFFNGLIWTPGMIKARLLLGSVGNDSILGYDGNDVIDGDLGDDNINAGAGDDIVDGGLGDDTLSGGSGADVYLFYRGAGRDKILNEDEVPGQVDTIKIASGIRPADLVLGRNENDLFISVVGESDQLTATGYFGGNQASVIENIAFADGTVWDFAYVKSKAAYRGSEGNDTLWGLSKDALIVGGAGDDSLNGNYGSDTLVGGAGNDTLQGGSGGDLYVFAPGDGRDFIDNLDGDGTNANPDILEFDAGVSERDVRFARVSDDLVVSIYGTLDQVTVSRFFDASNTARMIDKVRIKGGKEWSSTDLKNLVLVASNGADTLRGYSGNDTLSGADGHDWMVGNAGDDVLNGESGRDYLYAGSGNDRLDGGVGNDDLHGEEGNDTLVGGTGSDSLDGGQGQDTYLFNKGDGQDEIYNKDTDAAGAPVDIIKLGPGIAPADVLLKRDGERLVIEFKNTKDRLTVLNYYNSWDEIFNPESELKIQFTDSSTVWGNSYIATIAPPKITVGTAQADYLRLYKSGAGTLSGMAGDDSIYGNEGDDTLNGDSGKDLISGASGNDVIHGGAFGDTLYGDDGSDFLYGDASQDRLFGGNGNDTLDGGAGNDELRGEAGSDIYIFGIGSGQDTLYNDDADSVGVNPDTIKIGSGLLAQDVVFVNTGSDLIVKIKNSNDSLCIKNYFVSNGTTSSVVENILFTQNASVLGYSSIKSAAIFVDSSESSWINGTGLNDTLKGTSGSDHLEGFDGNDTLIGGAGNDKLDGSLGNDTYYFSRGFGNDTILALDNTPGKKDQIKFDATFSPGNLIVKRTGDALMVAFNNSQDSILVWDFFKGDASGGFQIEGISFSDASNTVLSKADILSKVLACSDDADYIRAYGTNDTISGGDGSDTLLGGGGNDRIDGGVERDLLDGGYGSDLLIGGDGSDSLYGCQSLIYDNVAGKYIVDSGVDTLDGGAGDDYIHCDNNDVIRFGYGFGYDQFVSSDSSDTGQALSRVIELGDGVLPENVVLSEDALTLDSGEVLSRTIYYSTGQEWMDFASAIKFKNGTVWDAAKILEILTKGLDGIDGVDDSIFGLSGNDSISGLRGDDHIYGEDGNDSLDGGIGEDSLDGGNGNDSLFGGSEDDYLYGGAGNDTLSGGNGNDLLADVGSGTGDIVALNTLVVSARASLYNAIGATMEVWADGTKLQTLTVSSTTLSNYTITVPTGTQAKEISVVFTNDAYDAATAQDRNLFVDQIVVNGQTIKGNAVGTVFDYGSGATARDGFNTYGGSGNLGSNGALRFSLVGTDYLDGGVGTDTLRGGIGNDVYVIDNAADVIQENASAGHDIVKSSVSYTLSDNLEDINLTGSTNIGANGNAGQNMLVGNSGNNRLDGKGGTDLMSGVQGDDTYVVDNAGDITWENAGAGVDTVESSINWTLQANTEILKLTGTGNLNGTGNISNNLLRGNAGVNALNGGAGNDILEGGAGNDILTDTSGSALFNGGAGADTLTGGAGAEIFLGGLGNDTYSTGAGNDIILFNKRDGQDSFAAGGTGSDTLSLGGGISYADLSLSKSANDLVLKVGSSDQITFKDWYATTPSKPVANLQVIADAMAGFVAGGSDPLKNQKVEKFNFAGLVGAFDTARAANSGLTTWALTNALSNFQLAGSDTAALGGDLAYQYGRNGTLAGIGATPALNTLSDSNLGSAAQTLSPLAGLQTGSARLS